MYQQIFMAESSSTPHRLRRASSASVRLAIALLLLLPAVSQVEAQWSRIPLQRGDLPPGGIPEFRISSDFEPVIVSNDGVRCLICDDTAWTSAPRFGDRWGSGRGVIHGPDGDYYRIEKDSGSGSLLRTSDCGRTWDLVTALGITDLARWDVSLWQMRFDATGGTYTQIRLTRFEIRNQQRFDFERVLHFRITNLAGSTVVEPIGESFKALFAQSGREYSGTDAIWKVMQTQSPRADSIYVWADSVWRPTGTFPSLGIVTPLFGRGVIFAFGSGIAWRSFDSGRTWRILDQFIPVDPYRARLGPDGRIILVARLEQRSVLLLGESNGDRWRYIPSPAVHFVDAAIRADGTIMLIDPHYAYWSTEEGRRWDSSRFAGSDITWGAPAPGGQLIAGGRRGSRLISRDGTGRVWEDLRPIGSNSRPNYVGRVIVGPAGVSVSDPWVIYRSDSNGLPLPSRTWSGSDGLRVWEPRILAWTIFGGGDSGAVVRGAFHEPQAQGLPIYRGDTLISWRPSTGEILLPTGNIQELMAASGGYLIGATDGRIRNSRDFGRSWLDLVSLPGSRHGALLATSSIEGRAFPGQYGFIHAVVAPAAASSDRLLVTFAADGMIERPLLGPLDERDDPFFGLRYLWTDFRGRLLLQARSGLYLSRHPLAWDSSPVEMQRLDLPCPLVIDSAVVAVSHTGREVIVTSHGHLWRLNLSDPPLLGTGKQERAASRPERFLIELQKDVITIAAISPKDAPATVTVASIDGSVVAGTSLAVGARARIDLSLHSRGVYLIVVRGPHGEEVKKVVLD